MAASLVDNYLFFFSAFSGRQYRLKRRRSGVQQTSFISNEAGLPVLDLYLVLPKERGKET